MLTTAFISRRQVSAPPPPPPSSNTLARGLRMYLKMDEASGSTLSDATAHGHDATSFAVSSGSGILGRCQDLAATGKITVDGESADFDSTAYSAALWVQMNPDGNERGLMCHEGGFGAFGWRLALGIMVPGILSIVHNGVGELDSPSTVNLTGGWHRVFVTYSGTTAKLYLDGVLLASGAIATRISAVGTGELMNIGCLSPISFFQFGFFPGLIDEVGYWNVEVSADDVGADWNDGAGLLFEDFGS